MSKHFINSSRLNSSFFTNSENILIFDLVFLIRSLMFFSIIISLFVILLASFIICNLFTIKSKESFSNSNILASFDIILQVHI